MLWLEQAFHVALRAELLQPCLLQCMGHELEVTQLTPTGLQLRCQNDTAGYLLRAGS